MKLRDKKTSKIWHMPKLRQPTVQEDDISFFACIGEHGCSRCELFSYHSLAELNEEWEDYKPAEPLIKDEKIRKAVRAWAEANEIGPQDTIRFNAIEHRLSWISTAIEFNEGNALLDLEKENYTIAELCGEEEE